MQKTSVTLLLDKSGSMQSIKETTITGYNEYLKGLKEGDAADNTEFSFVQFDSYSVDVIHTGTPVKEVPDLNGTTYQPNGGTPLIESAIKTIKAVETRVAGTDKKVVIAIQTDGHENASGTDYTWHDLNALIKEKLALGWQFNFMGVGIDAYDQAAKMGISQGSTMSTTLDPNEMRSSYRSMASNAALYASGAVSSTSFSKFQKCAAGDYTVSADATAVKPNSNPSSSKLETPRGKPRKTVDDFNLNDKK